MWERLKAPLQPSPPRRSNIQDRRSRRRRSPVVTAVPNFPSNLPTMRAFFILLLSSISAYLAEVLTSPWHPIRFARATAEPSKQRFVFIIAGL